MFCHSSPTAPPPPSNYSTTAEKWIFFRGSCCLSCHVSVNLFSFLKINFIIFRERARGRGRTGAGEGRGREADSLLSAETNAGSFPGPPRDLTPNQESAAYPTEPSRHPTFYDFIKRLRKTYIPFLEMEL